MNKTAEATFLCSLDSTASRRLLQIPQWMFDSVAMCGIRLTLSPVVDVASLHELKSLLSTEIDGVVVQGRHPSVDDAGENDAKVIEATACVVGWSHSDLQLPFKISSAPEWEVIQQLSPDAPCDLSVPNV